MKNELIIAENIKQKNTKSYDRMKKIISDLGLEKLQFRFL
jgi:hypothetical protein